jgi:hypothetical protein
VPETTEEWLAGLRRDNGGDSPFTLSREWLEDFVQRYPRAERPRIRAVWLARRGKTWSQIHDELMDDYKVQLFSVLDEKQLATAESQFWAVLPTFSFDAYQGPAPNGQPVIIVHHTLGHTLSQMAKVFLRIHEDRSVEFLANETGYLRFAAWVYEIWAKPGPPTVPAPDFSPRTADSVLLAESLAMGAIVFVLGHELGHAHLNHADYTSDVARNHAMEYEADATGLAILMRWAMLRGVATDSYYFKFSLFGGLMSLCTLQMLFGDGASDTHPSCRDRINRLLEGYDHAFQLALPDAHARRRFISEFADDDFEGIHRKAAAGFTNLLEMFSREETLATLRDLRDNKGFRLSQARFWSSGSQAQ